MVSTPEIHVHGLLLSFRPQRDGILSWRSWLTHSRQWSPVIHKTGEGQGEAIGQTPTS